MSFFSCKSRDDCWKYFDRHLEAIEPGKRTSARAYLLEREENVELGTIGSYLTHIKAFGIYLAEKPWKDATRDDVIGHIKSAAGRQGRVGRRHPKNGQSLGQYTKYQRMVMLREFYKWLYETDEMPQQFRRMPFSKPSMEEQSQAREDRLTQPEIMDMLAATQDKMERALVMLLLDSGFRAGEAAALDIRDVTFDDVGAKIMHSREAKGLKTARRRVPTRVTLAAPYLRDWIAIHPRRLHLDSPIFVSRSNRNHLERLGSAGVWSIITVLARKAKCRHIHPHMFRHTAASMRAGDGWNEEMLRLHFGWSKGSDMPSLYAHVEQDYDSFALRRAGLPVPVSKAQWTLQCRNCKVDSPGDAYFCGGCGRQLHEADARKPTGEPAEVG
ncbi:MAG: tyrosine-type recombinase/integrase [bacterium]